MPRSEEAGKSGIIAFRRGRIPSQVVVKDGFEARPQEHVDSVEEVVQDGYSSPLHNHRMCVRDLDHQKEPDAIAARGEVVLEVFDAKRQRPSKDLIERVMRLALCTSSGGKPSPLAMSCLIARSEHHIMYHRTMQKAR